MKTDWSKRLFAAPDATRITVVVAHPDDEVIGAGARLRHWPQAHVVHTTDGAPRNSADAWHAGFVTTEDYASARQRESMTALALAGIGVNQVHALNFSDQETALNLVPLARSLAGKFLLLRPDFVITQPYEGGHPDHDSTAFAVHAACDILRQEEAPAPVIVEATSYFNRAGIMATGEFLPRARLETKTFELTEEERRFKQRLFACFKTQQAVLEYFPIRVERFRIAPRYDFSQPPHPGRLHYENFEWGMTGERWRKLATAARRQLNHDPAARHPNPQRPTNIPRQPCT